jgi:hypothetical protein
VTRPDQGRTGERTVALAALGVETDSPWQDGCKAALGLVDNPGNGVEWPKPDYEMVGRPTSTHPDLARADLPLNFSTIRRDLDRIRTTLKRIDAQLALSSYIGLARDGMVLDPVRGQIPLEYLNTTTFPFRYRDIERAAILQNRCLPSMQRPTLAVLRRCRPHPEGPELFTDAIHMTYGGIRLHGWIVLQGLVPLVEKHLADGTWPANPAPALARLRAVFHATQVSFDCKN